MSHRWDGESVGGQGYADDDDTDGEGTAAGGAHKAKPRRKSHQRPQGSDQIRQAFSKRKKGLVLKAFQLNSLTDAKVFMFIVNDKGTSWAYATPGFANSLNSQVLKQLRALADVPEQAKLFTEVIPCPPNAKNPSSRGSSEQTGTQRTEPSAEYVPPSTRTATGSLPSRSRSSYSWGSDGQAPPGGHMGPDKLTRTSSNAANVRATQATPQSDEHSPTLPKARPPSGSSMACGTRASMPAAAGYYQQHPQAVGGRGPGMEPPTPCGIYNLLGQPASAQDSPSEVAMSCGGSPSSKLMPPPDAVATGRLMAANAQAAAAAAAAAVAEGAAAAAAGVVGMETFSMQVKNEPVTGDWAPQNQQLQDGAGRWDFDMYQAQYMQQQRQEQQYLQQQQQLYTQQQQQQYMQQYQQQQGGSVFSSMAPSSSTDGSGAVAMDIPCSGPDAAAAAAAAAGGSAGGPWGSCPAGLGANLLACADQLQQMQTQLQPQGQQDAFEALQRGLPPLRTMAASNNNGKRSFGATGSELDGSHSAPAGAVAGNGLGMPSQWVTFPSDNTAADGGAASLAGLRTASDTAMYGLIGGGGSSQGYSSYVPSPSSCNTNQQQQQAATGISSGGGGVRLPNAAQAMLMARAGGSGAVSQSPSPTAVLGHRMTTILAMHSPNTSPLHPSLMGDQQQQQQGSWAPAPPASGPNSTDGQFGSSSRPASSPQDMAYHPEQQQQHNQGAYMPQTDDLLSDPIVEMLMDQPLGQLTVDQKATGNDQHHPRHLSIMEATLAGQQQQVAPPQQDTVASSTSAPGAAAPGAAAAGGSSSPSWEPPQQSDAASITNVFAHIPPPPKTDAQADKAAWQAQVRRILGSLQPLQRQQLAKLSEQQWLKAQAGHTPSAATNGTMEAAGAAAAAAAGFISCSSGPPPPAQAAPAGSSAQAPPSSAPGSGGYGRAFGGKQRLGPSRLSSSSPAVDLGGGGSSGGPGSGQPPSSSPAAGGPSGADPASGLQQQLPGIATYFVSSEGLMMTSGGQQLPLPASQAMASMSVSMMPQAERLDGQACSLPMSYSMPMCSADMGYCVGAGAGAGTASQPLPASMLPMSAAEGAPAVGSNQVVSCSMSSTALSNGSTLYQMLPLPQQLLQGAPALEPVLAASGGGGPGSTPFGAAGVQGPVPLSDTCFIQDPEASPAAAAARGSGGGGSSNRASALLSESLLLPERSQQCASPLKRSQPSSGVFGSSGADQAGTQSPMKRVCTSNAMMMAHQQQQPQQQLLHVNRHHQQQQSALPEPPSFATLMQAEASGEEDAIAWATAAASGDGLRRVGDSCVSLGVSAAMGSMDSFPSAFLRLGSMPGEDSMQLLSAVSDMGPAAPHAAAEDDDGLTKA